MARDISMGRLPFWCKQLGLPIIIFCILLLLLLSSLVSIIDRASFLKQFTATTTRTNGIIPTKKHQEQGEVLLNRNSSFVLSHIDRIIHKPEQFRIEIHLKNKDDNGIPFARQCKNPFFVGRLSGWSLSTIRFDYYYHHDGGDIVNDGNKRRRNIIIGKYDPATIPLSGSHSYYIEILVLLCEEPNWDDNLQDLCLKDTNIPKTRITASPANITIDTGSIVNNKDNNNNKPPSGRWLHNSLRRTKRSKDEYNNNTSNCQQLLPDPLYTRYQPTGCMESEKYFKSTKNTTECQNAVDLGPFRSYKFVWDDPYMNRPLLPLKYLQFSNHQRSSSTSITTTTTTSTIQTTMKRSSQQSSPSATHVCFIGLSHSGTLAKKCNNLLLRHRKNINDELPFKLKCSHIQVKFPFQIIRGGPPDDLTSINKYDNNDNDNNNNNNNSAPIQQQQQQQSMMVRKREKQQKFWVYKNLIQPKCTHAVIGLYQWPFSFYQAEISSQLRFEDWKTDMENVIQIIAKNTNNNTNNDNSINDNSNNITINKNGSSRDNGNKLEIILRSVHTNGLKEHVTQCPPIDFRTPYNTMICNQILQDIAIASTKQNSTIITAKNVTATTNHALDNTTSSSNFINNDNNLSITYIDTGFITAPVWDSKKDWSHLNDEAGTEEIKYILYEILRRKTKQK